MAKIFHLRFRWEHLISDKNPTGVDCLGGVTVALQSNEDDTVTIAMSFCSEKDVYSRKIGRSIVDGRLKSGDCYKVKAGSLRDILTQNVFPKILSKYEKIYEGDHTIYMEALS